MEDLNKKEGFSRRGFLKTAAAVGAALAVSPALDKYRLPLVRLPEAKLHLPEMPKPQRLPLTARSAQARRLSRCRHWDSV